MEYTALQVVWFVLIAILWIGYFVLEGFDFGVGILLRVIGRTTAERRAVSAARSGRTGAAAGPRSPRERRTAA